MFIILLICYILLTSAGLLMIKLGGSATSVSLAAQGISMQMDFRLLMGLVCYAASFILFTVILQKQNLSVVYPLCAGIVNVFSVVLGMIVLKESVSPTGMAGIGLVILGIVLMNWGR